MCLRSLNLFLNFALNRQWLGLKLIRDGANDFIVGLYSGNIVVLAVPIWMNEHEPKFLNNLEHKLSETVQTAMEYQKASRYKISPASLQTSILLDGRDSLNVRVVNATRTSSIIHLHCIFAVLLNGFYLEAGSVAEDLNRLGLNELSAKIGYSVVKVRGLYEADQNHQTNYWIIGAVTGTVVILLLIGWCILFVYYNVCCGPSEIVIDKQNTNQQKAVDSLILSANNQATMQISTVLGRNTVLHKAIQTNLEKSVKKHEKAAVTLESKRMHNKACGINEASQT
uniref:Uncharacterized protein n=1 Tax=Romanomermis culicivorax TaxID=13658 RepID=A0A915KPE4_ROMCU